jgi:CRISPR/Cas system CSM-associated protein Csm3 (group 7 of RAMP superfamily)
MDTKPWHKFESARFLSIMHSHPNEIIGMWFRVWATLSNAKERWTKTGDTEMWSKIIGENEAKTKRFINYMILHINDMKVVIESSAYKKPVYTICDEYHQLRDQAVLVRKMNSKKYLRSDVTINRKALKEQVLSEYHPDKIDTRRTLFNNNFVRLMRNASRDFTSSEEKIDAEYKEASKILDYLKWLKTTDIWLEPSRIYGIARFIQAEVWEYDQDYIDFLKESGRTVTGK